MIPAAIALSVTLFALSARADEPLPISIDWQRLTEAFRGAGAILAPDAPAPKSRGQGEGSGWGPAGAYDRAGAEAPWETGGAANVVPDASLVARDWGGARLFVGHLSPMDHIRLSHSSRMIVGRIRLPAGRVIPFAELGLGQWRIDSDLLPGRREIDYAAQLGYGLELRISRYASVAFEADYTVLYRDQACSRRSSPPDLWGGFIAARAHF